MKIEKLMKNIKTELITLLRRNRGLIAYYLLTTRLYSPLYIPFRLLLKLVCLIL